MSRIWGITAYFGLAHCTRRLENYLAFRSSLQAQGLPLLTIELALRGNEFVLNEGHADKYLQRRSNSVLWHKERLLNLAVEHLPPECEYVCWIDSDLIFLEHSWVAETERLLQQTPAVQLFKTVYRTPADFDLAAYVRPDFDWSAVPFEYQRASGSQLYSLAYARSIKHMGTYTPGYAWAARREVLSSIGFYDCAIVGGGDHIIAEAMIGRRFREHFYHQCPAFAESLARYSFEMGKVVRGKLDYVDARIIHLNHGAWASRQYQERGDTLRRHNFDPAAHLETGTSGMSAGVWEWNTGNAVLKQEVEQYFATREMAAPGQEQPRASRSD